MVRAQAAAPPPPHPPHPPHLHRRPPHPPRPPRAFSPRRWQNRWKNSRSGVRRSSRTGRRTQRSKAGRWAGRDHRNRILLPSHLSSPGSAAVLVCDVKSAPCVVIMRPAMAVATNAKSVRDAESGRILSLENASRLAALAQQISRLLLSHPATPRVCARIARRMLAST